MKGSEANQPVAAAQSRPRTSHTDTISSRNRKDVPAGHVHEQERDVDINEAGSKSDDEPEATTTVVKGDGRGDMKRNRNRKRGIDKVVEIFQENVFDLIMFLFYSPGSMC